MLTTPIRKINASLRAKMLVLIGAVVVVLIALLYALSQAILMDSFAELEEQETHEDTRRVINALQGELDELHTLALDWSQWDDSYQFVQDGSAAYIESNLTDETFVSLQINLMMFTDTSGQLIYGRAFRLDDQVGIPLTQPLTNLYLYTNNPSALYAQLSDLRQVTEGLLATPNGVMILTGLPITRSDGSGEPKGKVFMGRYLDETRVDRISQLMGVTLELRDLADPTLPDDFRVAAEHLPSPESVFIQPLNRRTFVGYTLINDIADQPVLMARVMTARDISRQGQETVWFFLLATGLLALILVALYGGILERVVLARLLRLNQSIRRIGETGQLSARVAVIGQDELAALGQRINETLTALQTSQAALRGSESRYRALFENADDAIFLMRGDVFVECNPRVLTMFGCVRSQIVRQKPYDERFSPPIQPDGSLSRLKALEKITQALAGTPQRFEWRHTRYDGTPFEAEVTLNRVEVNQEVFLQAIVRDITERKRAEERLRQSEEQYSSLFSRVPINLYRTTPDGQIIVANPALVQLMGYPDLETLQKSTAPELYVNPVDRENWLQRLERDGIVRDVEIRLIRRDGTMIWVEDTARVVRDEQGRTLYYEGAIKDITAQKRAEQALRENEERYQYALHAAELGLWDWTVPTGEVVFNQRWAEIAGYSLDEVGTRTGLWETLVHPDDLPRVQAELDAHLNQQAPFYESEYRLRTRAGEWKWVQDRAKVVKHAANGKPMRVTGVLRDISAAKQAQAERERLLQQMQTRAEELATVAEISRQITTILDIDDLLWTVCDLVKESFKLYHAHVFLLDPDGQTIRLVAGAGEVGRQLIAVSHKFSLHQEPSLVARAARLRAPVIVNDVAQTTDFMPNPYLPRTQAEAVLPMLVGDLLIGVLDVQSEAAGRFATEDVNILTMLAAQIAVAIHNAHLFTDNARRLAIIEHSDDLIALADLKSYTPLYVNPAGLRLLGYDQPDDFFAHTIRHHYPVEALRHLREQAIPAALAHGAWRGENVAKRRDGTEFPVEQALFIIRDKDGQPRDLATIVTDITARKQAEKALQKANRAYRMLSECNQAMVRVNDETALLNEICATLVRTGDYRFVWVSYADEQDPTRTYPVAQAGYEAGYLAATRPPGYETTIPPGPSRTAIRTGATYVVRDIATDPSYAPWRDAALARGYRSMIALPLSVDQHVFGALNAYAPDANAFDDAEMVLLKELAEDLAYGISVLRARIARQEVAEQISQLNARLEKRNAELLALHQIAQTLTSTLDLRVIYQVMYREVAQGLFGAQHLMMAIYDPAHETISCDYAIVDGEEVDPAQFAAMPLGSGPNSRAIRSRQPVIVTLPTADSPASVPGVYVHIGDEREPRSALYAPLISGNTVIGVMNVQHYDPDAFQDTDATLMSILANQAATAIQNARLFAAERDQRSMAEALRDTITAFSQTLEMDIVLDRILENVRRVLPHDTASIILIEGDQARIVRHSGFVERGLAEAVDGLCFPIGGLYTLRRMLEIGRPLVIPDTQADPEWISIPDLEWLHAYVGVPIRRGDQLIGLLNLDSATPHFFSEADAERLQAFADQAALAIHNAQLFAGEHNQRTLAEALRDTAAAVNSTLDFEAVLDQIMANVGRVAPFDAANIMLVEEGVARIVRNYPDTGASQRRQWLADLRLNVSQTANLRQMTQTRQPILIEDTEQYAGWVDFPEARWVRSHVATPIRQDEQVIGFLLLDSAIPGFFDQAQAEQLQAFADQAATAIRNAQLFERVQRYAAELEQRVAERTQELEQQRAQLQAILDSMSEGVIYDEKLVVKYTNRALSHLSGYPPEEFSQQAYLEPLCRDAISPEEQRELAQSIYHVVEQQGIWRGERRFQRHDGSPFDASLTVTHVSDAAGRIVGAVTMIRDISQEKALREQRVRFIANASHELRTPLANIKTRLYLLQRQPEKAPYHMQILDQVAETMAELVENLLDVSRFERGVIALNPKETVLQGLVEQVVRVQQAEAERKHLAFEAHWPPDPLRALVDPQRLTQVITNLVTNAINYTPEGGQIIISLEAEGGQAVLRVRDTGIGIAPQMLTQVFEPFVRANEKVRGGTGLGLTIARDIVTLHGGTISVESEPGKGSTFTVRLNLLSEP
jgi:PAS domain S-box-containing protein